ncbi:helix-turn-helix domain-containing protein [Gottschalkiaceae bacterium SANA]|nr:helix-turn-helix domain-containing protein [Gottschalkiaceae bacterium SANA]
MKKYKIGEFARIKNIDAQTLRYYDRLGLLTPSEVDAETGYRYYTVDQFIQVDVIKFNKLLGLSLEEILRQKQIKSLDVKLSVIENQQVRLEEMIRQYNLVKENLEEIVTSIRQASEEFELVGNKPRIKAMGDLMGVVSDCSHLEDWGDFEEKIKELTLRYPEYYEVGHNHGLIFGGRFDLVFQQDDSYLDLIVMPYHGSKTDDPNIECFHLGTCVVAYHQDGQEAQSLTLNRMLTFIEENNLESKGMVMVRSIVGSFILSDHDAYLQEMIVPIKEM